jgi:PAS domain S-box-containing protein
MNLTQAQHILLFEHGERRFADHTAVIALLVCAGYFVGAELAFMLRIPSTHSAIIWAPNAVLLAVLLLTRPRTWAIWLLAALPAHLVAQSRDGGFVLVLLVPFFANVVQVIVAAMGLRCFAAAPPRFNTLRDMTLFVLIAAITAPALVSFLAAWLFVSVGWETDVWLVSRGRFLNNVTTGLTVAPLILMAAESGLAGLRRHRVQRYGELALLAGGLVGTLYAIHIWTTPGAKSIPVQLYAPLPFLLWAAVRFGPGGLCLLLLVVAAHSISETISGRGPYVAQTPAENVLALQISLAVLAAPLMFVAALIGERRKKAQALQESEQRYRAVIEDQTELVCRFLPDATLTFVNLAYASYFGKSPDQLIGQSFLSVIPEEERQAAMEHIQSLRKNPSPGSFERRVFTAQDELRWLQWVDRPIFDDEGSVVEFQSVGRDITERKRAESRLNTQYAITRILSESTSIDEAMPRIVQSICECLDWKVGEIWRVDGETKLSTFVKAWHSPSKDFAEFASASLGFTFPPGVGLPGRVCESRKPVWICNLAEDSSFRRVSLATKAGLRSGFGFPILLGEETLGAMVFFSREVREPDHDVLQMIANIGSQIGQFIERVERTDELTSVNEALRQEVAERTRSERALVETEDRLKRMADSVPEVIRITDLEPTERVVYTSPSFERVWGLRLEDLYQNPRLWTETIHPEDRARVAGTFSQWITGADVSYQDVEFRIVQPGGAVRWIHERGVLTVNAQGRPIRVSGISTDITDRKRAEEELTRAFEEIRRLKDRLQQENIALREEVEKASMFEEIVGASAQLRSVLSHLAKVAPTDSTVLIIGETGTGKELVARALHKRSRRSSRAFVSVNCAAIPASLIASELFGHEKGAFTGAVQRRQGRFELADHGTIFLDEVGELPPETQITLLRVLQEREFQRVGGNEAIHTDVRVIAATNRDLKAAVAEGTFRADLFYRLSVFPLEIPALRERRTDIPLLVEYFIHRYATRAGKRIRGVSKETWSLLQSYDWPGNIRELQNVVERAVIVADSDILSIDERWLSGRPFRPPAVASPRINALATHERDVIEAALRESKGRVAGPFGAATRLGVPSSTLESKIKALQIDKQRFKSP